MSWTWKQGSRKHAHVSRAFFAAVKWNCGSVKWNWNSGEKNWGGERALETCQRDSENNLQIWACIKYICKEICINKYRCIYIYIHIFIYEDRNYRKKIRTRYRHKEIDMHIQAQELHNGEVHMLKAVACCVWWHPMEVYWAANIHDINASDLGLCSRHWLL